MELILRLELGLALVHEGQGGLRFWRGAGQSFNQALANQASGGEYPPSSALRLTRVSALSLQDFGTGHWDLTRSLTSDTLDKRKSGWPSARRKTLDPCREPCRKKTI